MKRRERTTRHPDELLELTDSNKQTQNMSPATASPTRSTSLISDRSVTQLLQDHASDVAALKQLAKSTLLEAAAEHEESAAMDDAVPFNQDVYYLRFCLRAPDKPAEQQELLRNNIRWRLSPQGKTICQAARRAVQQATASGSWNNKPVQEAAPHSDRIHKYMADACLTTTTTKGDLVYIVRAAQVDAKTMMKEVSIDEMVDYLVYIKEVFAILCNQRSMDQDRVVAWITINDLLDANKKAGTNSKEFQKALSQSSKIAENNYPRMTGPALLLNLPAVLNAIAKLVSMAMPARVRNKLQFRRGVLGKDTVLKELHYGGSQREQFLADLDKIVYKEEA